MSESHSSGKKQGHDYSGWQEPVSARVEVRPGDLHNHYTLRELEKAVVEAKLKAANQRLKAVQDEIDALSKNKMALTDMSHP